MFCISEYTVLPSFYLPKSAPVLKVTYAAKVEIMDVISLIQEYAVDLHSVGRVPWHCLWRSGENIRSVSKHEFLSQRDLATGRHLLDFHL
jgi:hypothetical protein